MRRDNFCVILNHTNKPLLREMDGPVMKEKFTQIGKRTNYQHM
jgi:hypothetical protein